MRSIQTRLLCALLVIGLPLVLLSACGGGGGSGDSGTSSSAGTTSAAEEVASTGSVSVSLTDNQALYNAVVLTIEKIGIVASNTSTTYYNSADINELPVTVNVLDFPDESTFYLGDIKVPLPENGKEVCFSQFRLLLTENGQNSCDGPDYTYKQGNNEIKAQLCNYIERNDGTSYELKTPSATKSGAKVLFQEKGNEDEDAEDIFCLREEENAVNVTLDFDPDKAIKLFDKKNVDYYQMKPTGMRIIDGGFFTAPESFIDGMVAVPTYNTAGVCEEFSTAPLVTVAAYNSATIKSKTVTILAEDPVKYDVACEQWCEEDADCLADCPLTNDEGCYYTGSFKLLLPEKETYDLSAPWDGFNAEMLGVGYNSTVLLELEEQ
jgi:hypothetical protein